MKPLLLISALVASYMCYVDGQSSCTTPSGGKGDCIVLQECASLNSLISTPPVTEAVRDLLKKSHCGFQASQPKVCCPQQCFTPDGAVGQCVSIYSCDHLVKLLQPKPVPQNVLTYVQNSRCEGADQYSVCCGPAFTSVPAVAPTRKCVPSAAPPNPRTECCGLDPGAGNKIFGGNATFIDQYPWLVIIEYIKESSIKLLCGGSLISGRYVLTAGHCVRGAVLNLGTPRNVRLGEYDTSNDGPDCVEVEGGGTDCNEGTLIIPIEKIIPHPNYDPDHSLRRNDIALLRLSKMAPYSDFIRPICLPTVDISLSPPSRLRFYTAGWGAVSDTESKSKIKLHVDLPFVPNSICQPAYQKPKRNIALWNGQICAGGEAGKDSCKGDSGGPLMYENERLYEIIGVVSFGPTPCGMENIPGVYTKVFEYNSWIRSQIRP